MKKLFILLLIPIVFFAYELNENRYFITQDQGFFKLYRTIGTMAKDTAGKTVIWGEEIEIKPKFLILDKVNRRLWFKVDAKFSESETLSFIKNIDSVSYTNGTFLSSMIGLELMDASVQNIWNTTTSRILLATSNGVYMSANAGNSWAGQQLAQLPGPILQVCASPLNITSPSLGNTMMYGLWNNGTIYRRTLLGSSQWAKISDILFDYEDMESVNPNDTLVPSGWSRINDDSMFIMRTKEHARSSTGGDDTTTYSLKIYANNSKGDYYASYPMEDPLSKKIIELYVYFDTIPNVPEYTSGVITIIQNNKKIDLLLNSSGFSPLNNPDKIIDNFTLNKWNRVSIWCDFDKGKAIVFGEKRFYEMDLDTTSYSAKEIRLRAPVEKGYSYYVDDISIKPWIYDLVGYPNSKAKIYASTSDGIYMYDSTVWVKEFDYKGEPRYLVSDFKGNAYAFLDPTNKEVYFKKDSLSNWDTVTCDLPKDKEYYTIAIDDIGNLYLGSNNFVYRLKRDSTEWVNLSNGFTNYGLIEHVKLVKNIAPVSSETIFVANHNGVYRSNDGGLNWIQDNDSKIEPSVDYITQEQITKLDSIFENHIYSVVRDNIDSIIPDVDRDGKIHLIMMDILDTLGDGSSNWRTSYFSTVNEYTQSVNLNSNHAEIIYVDYRLFKTKQNATIDTMLFNFTDLVTWWNDKNEEFWLNMMFNTYTYHKLYYGDSVNTNTINLNLSFSLDPSNDLVSPFNYTSLKGGAFNISYAYIWYLIHKYSPDVVKELLKIKGYKIVDPIIGRRDSVILKGVESIDTLLIRKGSNFKNAFVDFAKSIVFKKISMLPNLTFDATPCTMVTRFSTRNIEPTNRQFYLTSRVIKFDTSFINKYGKNFARFNGGNTNDFILTMIKVKGNVLDTTNVIDTILDGVKNVYDIDLREIEDGRIDSLYLIVNNVSTSGTDPIYANFFITDDIEKDTTAFFGIIRSPIADRYARLFLYSKKKLYSDVGSETPIFKMLGKSLNMSLFDVLADGKRIYTADFVIPSKADTIVISAEDRAGNEYELKYPVWVEAVKKGGNYRFSNFNLYIPEGGFDGMLTTIASKNSIFLSSDFLKPVTLTMELPKGLENVSIYRMNGPNDFEEIESRRVGDVIQAKITTGGTYILGNGISKIENVKTGLSFFAVNPNMIKFTLERKSNIEIAVYDLSGRCVRVLEKGIFLQGTYEINEKLEIPSGIYFVVLKTDFGNYSRKLVNIR